MDTSLCKLTLSCPKSGAVSIIDALDDLQPALPGYTLLDGQGRGPSLDYSSASEEVQGAARIVMIIIVLPADQIDDVLSMIRESYRRPQLSYWVEPVLDFGRLQ